jgi:hypothetical protein
MLPVVEIASLNNLGANQSARWRGLFFCWVDTGTAVDPIILAANLCFFYKLVLCSQEIGLLLSLNMTVKRRISGSYSSGYKEFYLLGYNAI